VKAFRFGGATMLAHEIGNADRPAAGQRPAELAAVR
jgi:hypothetical protein